MLVQGFDQGDYSFTDTIFSEDPEEGGMPYSVEGLPEIYEVVIEVLLMVAILLNHESKIEYLFHSASSLTETGLFFRQDMFYLRLHSV